MCVFRKPKEGVGFEVRVVHESVERRLQLLAV